MTSPSSPVDSIEKAMDAQPAMSDAELYTAAGIILKIAMGKVKVGRGRKARMDWKAEQDPLALVCGIDAIISLVKRAEVA